MSVCMVYGWYTWKDGWRMLVYSNREEGRPKQSNRKQSNRKREPARRPLHTLCVAQHITSASEGGRVGRAGAGTAIAPEGAKQDRPNESKTKANKQQAEPKTKTKQKRIQQG